MSKGKRISRRQFLGLAAVSAAGALLASTQLEPTAGVWRRLLNRVSRELQRRTATEAPNVPGRSNVFRVDGIPAPTWQTPFHEGVDALLELMGRNGLKFYRTAATSTLGGPEGLIAADDVVLLKVNAQWKQRGMTNTDVLRGLVQRIVAHPDGFRGEVVVADNGQGQDYFSCANENNDDTSDHTQSMQAIVERFRADLGARISIYNWRTIKAETVAEYDQGDEGDGYVLAGPYPLNYPKFTTEAGTHISLRHGVWNGSQYDHSRLKLINVPVLKAHLMFGATGAIKNVIGCVSRYAGVDEVGGDTWIFHDAFTKAFNGLPAGLPGSLWALHFPTLNVLDAIYVSPLGNRSQDATFEATPRQGTLLASIDPIALDYYAAKHVLGAVQRAVSCPRHTAESADPDRGSVFRQYILFAQARLLEAGYTVRFGAEGVNLIQETME